MLRCSEEADFWEPILRHVWHCVLLMQRELGCLSVGPCRSYVASQCPQKTNFEVRIMLFYIKVWFWLLGSLLPPLNLLLYTKILKTTSEGESHLAVVPTGALLFTRASLIRSYSCRKRHLYSASEGFPKSISKAASLVNSELNQLSECGWLYPAPPHISVLCGIKTLQSLPAQSLTPSPLALLPLFALFPFYWGPVLCFFLSFQNFWVVGVSLNFIYLKWLVMFSWYIDVKPLKKLKSQEFLYTVQ